MLCVTPPKNFRKGHAMRFNFSNKIQLLLVVFAVQGLLAVERIPFDHEFDFSDYTGQTFLSFMRTKVKPALDKVATEGYEMCGAKEVSRAYRLSATKVQNKVERWGGVEAVSELAETMKGTNVNLNTLPKEILRASNDTDIDAGDRFDIATFLGLACGGGVAIKFYEDNYGLNVHYDTLEQRSGRSFGIGPTRAANDASDKDYLNDLEDYVTGDSENTSEFYKALLMSLLNSDSSNYENVSEEGQTVLTDFLAVFTAEQARNLMDGRITPHWDAALLEVTLLAAFHAGQDDIRLYYQNPKTKETTFTNRTLKQTRCDYPTAPKKAGLMDYWQFSRRVTDTKNCGRSGINITKSEFRLLGKGITTYLNENSPKLMKRVASSMGLNRASKNVFQDLSTFLISKNSPKKIPSREAETIATAWVALLDAIQEQAEDISAALE